ncbi:CoA binding domain protein [Kordia sp. SMS9]|uniref:CoA-binding protein n=1 Tax=Kordia sp. SMS9 TaxID=2282170 RepID=UPI000E0D8004|nr:CoA-binding protein [Kordia sp. SMS9]AXG70192.1 CoA binding domain protein [Kordia sp. SMS9]
MKTLVLGASTKSHRFSHKAVHRLVANGHEVVAFGLKEGEINGVAIDTTLKPYEDIHTVTLYLNPTAQEAYYEYIFSLQPTRIIFNPGTENPSFIKELQEKDIKCEVACTLIMLASNQY